MEFSSSAFKFGQDELLLKKKATCNQGQGLGKTSPLCSTGGPYGMLILFKEKIEVQFLCTYDLWLLITLIGLNH